MLQPLRLGFAEPPPLGGEALDARPPKASPMRGSWLRSEAEQTDEVDSAANPGAPTSSVTAAPCHLPLIGEGHDARKSGSAVGRAA